MPLLRSRSSSTIHFARECRQNYFNIDPACMPGLTALLACVERVEAVVAKRLALFWGWATTTR